MALYSPDGKSLASASHDGTVRLWDAITGAEKRSADVHGSLVYGLVFTKDGAGVVSGSWDKSAKLLSVKDLEEKRVFASAQDRPDLKFPLLGAACSPDGTLLAVCGEEKVIKLVDAKTGQILRALEGHEDMVARVAFAPDGKTLASAGFDGTILLWSVATGKVVGTLKGHMNWVFAIAFSADGKLLASGGYDRTVRLWDPVKCVPLATLGKHRGGVRGVAFSRDGQWVASGGSDKIVKVWSVAKREAVHTFKGHDDAVRAVSFSPDGRYLASGGEDNVVRLWDLVTGKGGANNRLNDVVRDLCFSPRGNSLAAACQDGTLRILDPRTVGVRGNFFAHQTGATALAYALDGHTLYTAGSDQLVRAWKGALVGRQPRQTLRNHGGQTWVSLLTHDGEHLITAGSDTTVQVRRTKSRAVAPKAQTGLVVGVAYSKDGTMLATACGDRSVKVWDIKTGRLRNVLVGHTEDVWGVAFSPDGKLLASSGGKFSDRKQPGQLKVFDLATDKERFSLVGHHGIVSEVAFSPDGKLLASCGWDGTVRLWDVTTGKERAALDSFKGIVVHSISFSPDGRMLAAASFDGTIKLWDARSAKEIATMQAEQSVLQGIAFSPDGTTLAIGCNPSGDADRPIWGSPGEGEVALWDVALRKEIRRLKGWQGKVLSVAFSDDGKTLAAGGGKMNPALGEVKLWDWHSGELIASLSGARQFVSRLAFAPGGGALAAGGGANAIRDGLTVWDVNVEREHKRLKGHTGNVTCAVLSADGKTLATGSADMTICLWSTTTWTLQATLKGHTGQVRCLAFAPGEATLASASDDRTVRLWDVAAAKEKRVLCKHKVGAHAVAWSPDGSLLATASSEQGKPVGEIRVFETPGWKERGGAEWSKRGALSVAFSPDGRWLATGAPGFPSLHIYDVKSGKTTNVVQAASVRHVAFSPDGKTLATGHGTGSRRGNGGIQLWETTKWQEVGFLEGNEALCLTVAFSRDGRLLCSASTDGTARVWELSQLGRLRARR
jgi:WD40 repeat protein